MPSNQELLPIGIVAGRCGVSVATLRFYEERGLVTSIRTEGQKRMYTRSVIRRVAFIKVAQRVGLTLDEIATALELLPNQRTPNAKDWNRLSASWRLRIDEQIRTLEGLRDDLDSCIGCGCLSLGTCKLYNPDDRAAKLGTGARYLLGDAPSDTNK
ncbi:redox-sensitive transcriptional activator SoxR [Ferrimicrobium acidiphilum]|jgi:MerR family redox-sensitive transcriptional activator SoxR|uniref:redox-sensitive transcriptional activator SoxR n=1 Tax=Ferrimicrobium acidiphilum TaxID=121039 RepID=UPI0023EFF4C2|nr:redox-sensitive transcriptional activator SoxR [Ferrimicrobium acidiphilum]MCL5053110.1 redox-sensitive transcriptional activator SoxR [Gammaproteobacteria bacterium]